MSRFIAALVAALLALVCTAPALAATTGLVRGTITVDDKPASGATVTLEGEGSLFKTTTDAKGNYVFPEVPFGSYRLIAQAGALTRCRSSSTSPAVKSRRSTFHYRLNSSRSRRPR